MKYKLLLFFAFSINLLFAGNSKKTDLGPSIGLKMFSYFAGPGFVNYTFSIKNNGDQPLTNIYITDVTIGGTDVIDIYYNFPPGTVISSLAPGQEDTVSFQGNKLMMSSACFDAAQTQVHATAPDSTEITDLSDPYDYYLDQYTYCQYSNYVQLNVAHVYSDSNNNAVVDVGDDVNYTYSTVPGDFAEFMIIDENVIIDNPIASSIPGWTAHGVHHLTQADVDLGYVFNSVNFIDNSPCGQIYYGMDNNFCTGCPTTSSGIFNCTTKLTDLLPNMISGQVKFNSNNDNCATGTAFPDRRVVITDGTNSFTTFTNATGNYSILIPGAGSYSTNAASSLNSNFSSNPVSVPVVSSGENVNYADTDFCISSVANLSDLSIHLLPLDHARPGFTSHYRLCYTNNGSTALSGSLQIVFDQAKVGFAIAAPAQTTLAGNSLTWNYTNLIPFEHRFINLEFDVMVPPTVNDGDVLHFSASGTPLAGDNFPADNTQEFDQDVVNAFDPNDKTVLEGALIDASQVPNYLHYVTRFQNTGSASATTVVLKETLDADLDWNSFEPLGASHAYNLQIRNGNEVTCTFSNIGLPGSTANEAASHGWLAYKIKPLPTFAIGNVASSKSDIYFDFNLPINTNTVTTQLEVLSVKDFNTNNFRIFPNPASGFVNISCNSTMTSVELLDIQGRVLETSSENKKEARLDISDKVKGIYFVRITSDQEKSVEKLIIK